jgi:hypothetical protein
MSDTTLDHPLVRGYLAELAGALAGLPAGQARELTEQITAHLDEALAPGSDDAQVAAVLARLGSPAGLAAEAGPEVPVRARRRFWLGWRGWTIAGVVVLLPAAAGGARVLAMATAAPIEFSGANGWWYQQDFKHDVYTQADGVQQVTTPIRSGQRQGVVISVSNPSGLTQTVLGAVPGTDSPGSGTGQVMIARPDNNGFTPQWYHPYSIPFSIPPHGDEALRVLWTSTACLRPRQQRGIDQLSLRVRVGWLTRTEVVQLGGGFYLSGPSHGRCT